MLHFQFILAIVTSIIGNETIFTFSKDYCFPHTVKQITASFNLFFISFVVLWGKTRETEVKFNAIEFYPVSDMMYMMSVGISIIRDHYTLCA